MRGNQSYATENYSYDIAGNVTSSCDALGHCTAYAYSDPQNTYAHPTTITNPKAQQTKAQYDFNSGKLISATDLNGVNTVFSYDDPLERITQVRRAAGGGPHLESQTNYTYVGATAIVRSQDQNTTGDKATGNQTIYDGFGRPITADTNESGTFTESRTTYDALGRVASKTNPSRPNDGLNFPTTFSYDALGRLKSVQTADTAKTSTSYTGNQLTVTDQAGKQRQMTYDALGRLTSVVEDPGVVPASFLLEPRTEMKLNLSRINVKEFAASEHRSKRLQCVFIRLVGLRGANRWLGVVHQGEIRPFIECELLAPAQGLKRVVISSAEAFAKLSLGLVPIGCVC